MDNEEQGGELEAEQGDGQGGEQGGELKAEQGDGQ